MKTPDIIESEQEDQQEDQQEEQQEDQQEDMQETEIEGEIHEEKVEIIPELSKWEIITEYYSDKTDKPKHELLDGLIRSFVAPVKLHDLNIRHFPYKFYIVPLIIPGEEIKYCIVYVLEISEALEIVKIQPKKIQNVILENIQNKSNLTKKIEDILKQKNKILQKIESVEILQNEIGTIANKLIDEGKFEEAQKIIKLAKNIPSKLVSAYKKSKIEVKAHHFRVAEKELKDSLNYAKKIDDKNLQAYLELKVDTVRKIPSYQKEVKSKYSSVAKVLSKYSKFLSYSTQIPKLHKCMELLDKLEEDQQIEEIIELERYLVDAQQLVRNLRDLDRQIKRIIRNLKE